MRLIERERIDVVPLTAVLLASVSFFGPFAALKENRVVDGQIIRGFELLGGGLGAGVLILGALTLVVALSGGGGKTRNLVYSFAGVACLWITAVLLVRAGALLGQAGEAPRVSPAIGFWGLPGASYVLIDHSRRQAPRWRSLMLTVCALVPVCLIFSDGRGAAISVFQEWLERQDRFLDELIVHVRLFVFAILGATVFGLPLGIIASKNKRIERLVIAFVDVVQTIPSMALFGLLMAPLAALSRAFPLLRSLGLRGIGAAPALIALTLYALLPIARNAIVGIASVPLPALEAGRGMGMSRRQLFWRIKWPLALPYILTGLKTASVQAVGNAAVAALIGAGGLGIMIFQGLGQAAPDLILLGVLPLILMAVLVNRGWELVIRRAVSPGLLGEVL
ncbi:L-proline glycine betaine ABC transport system permease protein ProW (TC 3.A.1.12.1) [Olavius algarvensis spirochete endosymbiont]|uniref:ABC transporter permease n=1 Tax=Olavius algarvensis spirochete endosymbiont TaxID=260710 RepID=UPI000F286E44|nr:ABC transporter permease [Olavius algarvensis spirochete endosymbiont]VDB00675.1 L-proline glycine betaine ABC transport system permease protein ProW (TC 3.A.1.12.1) [Olavius algarvensis spirochete endosymbiont]